MAVSKGSHGSIAGTAAEAYVWMRLLQNGMLPYLPLADLEGVDLGVKGASGNFLKLQVKSRGFPLPDTGTYGEQIKDLWWGANELAFDYLVIVLPKNNPQEYEAWVVPQSEVRGHMSKIGGDLTLSRLLLREKWARYHECWNL